MKTVEEINDEIRELKESGQSVKGISDTHHTFKQCYDIRDTYFKALCHAYPYLAWKSKKHFDEKNDPISNFNGCFIVGINTPQGTISRHVKLEHWDEFEVQENVELFEQPVMNETKIILAMIYRAYCCDDAENKELTEYDKLQEEIEEKIKKEKYNPDNIF